MTINEVFILEKSETVESKSVLSRSNLHSPTMLNRFIYFFLKDGYASVS